MKHAIPILLLLLCCCAASPAAGMVITTEDYVVINTTTDDDILSGATTLIIDAPVKSVTWSGTRLVVNAPVETNILAMGGIVTVNATVGGDIMAISGALTTEADIGGKVMAVAPRAAFNGNATNVMVTGTTVTLGPEAVISNDMMVSARSYDPQGTVMGETSFDQKGMLGGDMASGQRGAVDFPDLAAAIGFVLLILRVFLAIGVFLLGIVLIAVAGDHVRAAAAPMSTPGGAFLSLLAGLAGVIVAGSLIFLLGLTFVGIPIAIALSCLFLLALLAAVPVTAWCTGRWVLTLTGKEVPEQGTTTMYVPFTVGYVILVILFLLPWGIGFAIQFITVFIGLGAILQMLYEEYNRRRDAKKATEDKETEKAHVDEESKPAIDAELEREIEDAAEEE